MNNVDCTVQSKSFVKDTAERWGVDPSTVSRHLQIAEEYSNIGINKIDAMLKEPNCPFVLYVGTRRLVKRAEFEEFIRQKLVI